MRTMAPALTVQPPAPANLAELLKLGFDGGDMTVLRADRMARLQCDPEDAAALMDLCTIEQISGDQASGLRRQAEALSHHRLYRSSWPTSKDALCVLAFMTPGDISANTPIEFLLQRSGVVLYSLYIVPGQPIPSTLPDHDVAIVIASESDEVRSVMREIERLIANWPCRVLNRPGNILRLAREELYRVLENVPGLVMPSTTRIDRAALEESGRGAPVSFPLIVRPVGSHAGRGLAKLDDAAAIAVYLAERQEVEFFISRYVDYRSADGQFRKYRIIWVDGRLYPCHMAIANQWKVWYLNADMAASAGKRAEEEQFMSTFDHGFAHRHASALAAAAERIGLEYVGIDCAELPDGKLLVFEGDVALVVHDMDPPDLYPYKGPQMQKLFSAFSDMLKRSAAVRG
jgi:glutathione synthase/RimK-type ligase-like ATP-grasp enzyme